MALPARSDVKEEYTWDLSPLFTSVEDWEQAFSRAESSIEQLDARRGVIQSEPERLAEVLETYFSGEQILDRAFTFAKLKADEDTTNSTHQALQQRAASLVARFSAAASYLKPDVLSLSDTVLEALLQKDDLKPYERVLREILRSRPHSLSEQEERLLAMSSEVLRAPGQIYSQLSNADLSFGEIKTSAGVVPLTHSTFLLLLKNKDRNVRRDTFTRYYEQYDAHKNAMAASLGASIKRDVFIARARGFKSAREASLFPDNVSPAVYDTLVSSVNDSLGPMHRYYALRNKVLGTDPGRIYDTYVSLLPEASMKTPYEEGAEIIRNACLPLGEEYAATLYDGLTSGRWVDRFENKGKASGAYSSGCYGSPPYILMSYNETDLRDVFTLAHEAGHSMHSHYARQTQPYQDSDYTIFVAEVASTFTEQLLLRELRKRNADKPEILAYLINHEIDDIKATLYRQTMFAEFEALTHAKAEAHEALTIDSFREMYAELLKKYFGTAIQLGDLDDLECLRIPHFYSAFYVYKYATGISAAIALAEDVASGNTEARDAYLEFLTLGGSKYPLEQLLHAGVDLSTPEPVERACKHYGTLVSELETHLDK